MFLPKEFYLKSFFVRSRFPGSTPHIVTGEVIYLGPSCECRRYGLIWFCWFLVFARHLKSVRPSCCTAQWLRTFHNTPRSLCNTSRTLRSTARTLDSTSRTLRSRAVKVWKSKWVRHFRSQGLVAITNMPGHFWSHTILVMSQFKVIFHSEQHLCVMWIMWWILLVFILLKNLFKRGSRGFSPRKFLKIRLGILPFPRF